MAKRTNDLTEFAQPVAEALAARCGSLKRVLSAGVLALDALSPTQREYFMAKAIGQEMELPEMPDEEFQRKVLQVLQAARAISAKKQHVPKARSAKSG